MDKSPALSEKKLFFRDTLRGRLHDTIFKQKRNKIMHFDHSFTRQCCLRGMKMQAFENGIQSANF